MSAVFVPLKKASAPHVMNATTTSVIRTWVSVHPVANILSPDLRPSMFCAQ